MAGIFDLADLRAAAGRAGVKGTDEELILDYSRRTGRDPTEIAGYLGYDLGGKWGNRLGASVDSYQANMYGLGEAITGSDWMRRQRQSNEAAAGLQREIARSQGAISSYKDVDSIGDGLDYLGGLAVDSLPYAGEALLGGFGAARLAGRGLQGAIQAGRAADASVDAVRAGQVAERALATRSTLGGVAASYPSAVGDILSNQREASGDGQVDLLSAAVGGIPYAALNAVGIEGALARRSLARGVGEGGAVRRLGRSIGLGMVTEGASEAGQEMVNQGFGRMAVDPNAGLFDADALERYGESFVGGAALGGAFGSVGGWRQSQEYVDHQRLQGARQREQMAIEVAEKQRELDLLNQTKETFGRGVPLQLGYDPSANEPWIALPDGSTMRRSEFEAMPVLAQEYLRRRGSRVNEEGSVEGFLSQMSAPRPVIDSLPEDPTYAGLYGAPEGLTRFPGALPYLADLQLGRPTPMEGLPEGYGGADAEAELQREREERAQQEHRNRAIDAYKTFGVLTPAQLQHAVATGTDPLKLLTPEQSRLVTDRPRNALALIRAQMASGVLSEEAGSNIIGELREAVENNRVDTQNRILKEAKQRASQQPVVPGTAGTPGGPVAGESDQPGRSPGAARPVAGGGVAEPNVGAELADAGGEANPTLAGAGAVGAARARPTELSLPDRINAIAASNPDAPVTVRVKGKEKTITRSQMADKLRKALSNPKHRAILEAAMLRVGGQKLGGEEIAAYVTRVTGEPYTKQSVDEFLGGLGLTLDKLDQLGAAGVDTVTEEELGMGAGTEDATYRTAETLGDAASDGVIDEGLTSAQKKLKAEADTLLSDTRTKAERTRDNLDAALAGDVTEEERAANRERERSQIQREILADLQNPALADDVLMAGNDWNEMIQLDSTPTWENLQPHVKYQWVRAHRVLRREDADLQAFEDEANDFEKALAAGEFDGSPVKGAAEALPRNRRDPGPRDVLAGQRGPGAAALPAPGDAEPEVVVGDGTRAQGVKIERKGAKAPKVRDYAHLSGVELTDTIEVDGASTVMRLKADVELKRLDKLESDLKAIIDCVKGGR